MEGWWPFESLHISETVMLSASPENWKDEGGQK